MLSLAAGVPESVFTRKKTSSQRSVSSSLRSQREEAADAMLKSRQQKGKTKTKP
jgi:hypothetical protein